jgi:hypothetical protein
MFETPDAANQRILVQGLALMNNSLARLAHAAEAIAKKMDPDFKTLGEKEGETRRSRFIPKSEI